MTAKMNILSPTEAGELNYNIFSTTKHYMYKEYLAKIY
jgi:hypothetical protein